MAEVKIKFWNMSDTGLKMRAVLAAKRKSITIAFLKNADRARHGGLWTDLETQFTRGSDQHPTETVAACNLLMNYKALPRQLQTRQRQQQQDNAESTSGISALAFLHSTPVAETDGVAHPTVECFDCHDKGHHANLCPSRQGMTYTLSQNHFKTSKKRRTSKKKSPIRARSLSWATISTRVATLVPTHRFYLTASQQCQFSRTDPS
jgi:hypothetical protein